jgi:hypothetical protein
MIFPVEKRSVVAQASIAAATSSTVPIRLSGMVAAVF